MGEFVYHFSPVRADLTNFSPPKEKASKPKQSPLLSHTTQKQSQSVGCRQPHPQQYPARGTEEAEEEAGDMAVVVVEEGVALEEAGDTEVGADEVR